jgi:hypothetical protein
MFNALDVIKDKGSDAKIQLVVEKLVRPLLELTATAELTGDAKQLCRYILHQLKGLNAGVGIRRWAGYYMHTLMESCQSLYKAAVHKLRDITTAAVVAHVPQNELSQACYHRALPWTAWDLRGDKSHPILLNAEYATFSDVWTDATTLTFRGEHISARQYPTEPHVPSAAKSSPAACLQDVVPDLAAVGAFESDADAYRWLFK